MRARLTIVIALGLASAACSRAPSFDERFNAQAAQLQNQAEEMQRNLSLALDASNAAQPDEGRANDAAGAATP